MAKAQKWGGGGGGKSDRRVTVSKVRPNLVQEGSWPQWVQKEVLETAEGK